MHREHTEIAAPSWGKEFMMAIDAVFPCPRNCSERVRALHAYLCLRSLMHLEAQNIFSKEMNRKVNHSAGTRHPYLHFLNHNSVPVQVPLNNENTRIQNADSRFVLVCLNGVRRDRASEGG